MEEEQTSPTPPGVDPVEAVEPTDAIIDLGQPVPRGPSRRRLWYIMAVALAVTVVAVVVYGLGRDRSTTTATPDLGASPSRSASQDQSSIFLPAVTPIQAHFPDALHGYVLTMRCESRVLEECTAAIAITSDAGMSWSRSALPSGVAGGTAFMSKLYVLTPRTLVLDRPAGLGVMDRSASDRAFPAPSLGPDGLPTYPDPTKLPGYVPSGRWLSQDAGRSWRSVSTEPAGTVSEIPIGGLLFFPVQDIFQPGAFDPRTAGSNALVLRPNGTSGRLRNGPAGGEFMQSAVTEASDGSVWVMGWSLPDMTTNPTGPIAEPAPVLQVSRDRGRTWRMVPTARGGTLAEFHTADGRNLYLMLYSENGEPSVVRSADGGASWHHIELPDAGSPNLLGTVLGGLFGGGPPGTSVAPLPDGGLLVASGGGLWRLPPGGALTKIGGPRVGGVIPAGHWVLAASPELSTFYGSPDGLVWHELDLG